MKNYLNLSKIQTSSHFDVQKDILKWSWNAKIELDYFD